MLWPLQIETCAPIPFPTFTQGGGATVVPTVETGLRDNGMLTSCLRSQSWQMMGLG